jgi:protein-disulfide isomerase
MKRYLTAALTLCLALATPAAAFDLSSMSDTERTAFRAEIRAYLLDNPEVIMEAVKVLEDRENTAKVADDKNLVKVNADDLFHDPNSWVGGNPDGDITVVEFMDYRCGYCRKAHDEVNELLSSDGNIRFIRKEFPILGPDSITSSKFALAVKLIAGDESYQSASEALITLKSSPEDAVLRRLANTLDVDADAVMAKMDSPEVEAIIDANHLLGQRLQINGTPTFVFQDQMLRGYVPLPGMRAVVAKLRAD